MTEAISTTDPTKTAPRRRACDGTLDELKADLRQGAKDWEAIKHLYEDD